MNMNQAENFIDTAESAPALFVLQFKNAYRLAFDLALATDGHFDKIYDEDYEGVNYRLILNEWQNGVLYEDFRFEWLITKIACNHIAQEEGTPQYQVEMEAYVANRDIQHRTELKRLRDDIVKLEQYPTERFEAYPGPEPYEEDLFNPPHIHTTKWLNYMLNVNRWMLSLYIAPAAGDIPWPTNVNTTHWRLSFVDSYNAVDYYEDEANREGGFGGGWVDQVKHLLQSDINLVGSQIEAVYEGTFVSSAMFDELMAGESLMGVELVDPEQPLIYQSQIRARTTPTIVNVVYTAESTLVTFRVEPLSAGLYNPETGEHTVITEFEDVIVEIFRADVLDYWEQIPFDPFEKLPPEWPNLTPGA